MQAQSAAAEWTPPPGLRLRPASIAAFRVTDTATDSSVGCPSVNPFDSPPSSLWGTLEHESPAAAETGSSAHGGHPAGGLELPWPAQVARRAADKSALCAAQMAALRAHLAVVSPGAHAWLQAPAQADFHLSQIRGAGGYDVLVTSSLMQGGFGKLRLGQRLNGTDVDAPIQAVKESRMECRRALDSHKTQGKHGPRTYFTSDRMLKDELTAAQTFSRRCRPEAVFDCEGKIYTLMQLMPCSLGTASWRLRAQHDLNRQVAAGFYVFCAGVELMGDAHRAGQVHGDIKPENLLLGAGGELELADWGISRHTGGDGLVHDMSCTLAYAAPELLLAGGAGGGADMWSLAVSVMEVVDPALQRERNRPRRRGDFLSTLHAIGLVSPRFANWLHDRIFVHEPLGRAGTFEASATLTGWDEHHHLYPRGQEALAQVAEPEVPIAMGRAILAAYCEICGQGRGQTCGSCAPAAAALGDKRGKPAVAHSPPSASTRRASQLG